MRLKWAGFLCFNIRIGRRIIIVRRLHMRTQQSINRSSRMCGGFFIFLSIYSVALSGLYFSLGEWGFASLLLPGVVFSAVISWLALRSSVCISRSAGGAGLEGAWKPVPIGPAPTHHLAAAKDLPPSEKTHSLPKD